MPTSTSRKRSCRPSEPSPVRSAPRHLVMSGVPSSIGMRTLRWLIAVSFVAGACTQGSPSAPPPAPPVTSSSTGTSSGTPSPAAAVLADGTPLPSGCPGPPLPSQTVAFVSSGRAWALDPATDTLSCLFPVRDPGPFAWGPQGDRVLLGGFRVHGLNAEAPELPGIAAEPATFDWGHPIGLAVVFAGAAGEPEKRFMDDGRVERLTALPKGSYLQVAYHPSGLALALGAGGGGGDAGGRGVGGGGGAVGPGGGVGAAGGRWGPGERCVPGGWPRPARAGWRTGEGRGGAG